MKILKENNITLKLILKSILLFFSLYIYIYNPIFKFLDFGSVKILLGISFIYLIFSSKLRIFLTKFEKEILFTLALIFYSLLIEAFIGPAGIGMMYRHFIWFLEGFLIPFFLILFFKDIFFKYGYIRLVIIVGFIASLITLYLILNPNVNLFIRNEVIIDSLDSFTDTWTFRGFTIAENSSYSYSVVQGVILGFCLFKLKNNLLYLFPILTLFISIIFNARIGISVIIIALFLFLIYKQIELKKILILLIILIGLFTFIDLSSFIEENIQSVEWGLDFFTQTRDFLSGKRNENTYGTLFGDMIFFPENSVDFMFGTGINIFHNVKKSSDVGFIIQIFEGGLVYIFLMLFFLFLMYKRILKVEKITLFPIFLITVILIANIKGNALFVSTGFFRLFTLYYVHLILDKRSCF